MKIKINNNNDTIYKVHVLNGYEIVKEMKCCENAIVVVSHEMKIVQYKTIAVCNKEHTIFYCIFTIKYFWDSIQFDSQFTYTHVYVWRLFNATLFALFRSRCMCVCVCGTSVYERKCLSLEHYLQHCHDRLTAVAAVCFSTGALDDKKLAFNRKSHKSSH